MKPHGETAISSFFRLVSRTLRASRERFVPPPSWYRPDDALAEIWFPTRGCRWDFLGYCNMCNFGFPGAVTPQQAINAVRSGLAEVGDRATSIWISPFNMLDETEVPAGTRREIMRLLAATRARLVIIETHPETVTRELVSECLDLLAGKALSVELGVESMDPFVRLVCINKSFSNDVIEGALINIHAAGAMSNVNLFVGAPFLSREEQIADAVTSVKAAFLAGADHVVLFPAHIKPHTLVAWMYDRGMHERFSLWSIVDVLRRLGPERLPFIHVAWAAAKNHPGAAMVAEAGTCPSCIGHLLNTLDRQDKILRPEAIAALDAIRCACRLAPSPAVPPLVQRISATLPRIGAGILGEHWWSEHGDETLRSLADVWAGYRE